MHFCEWPASSGAKGTQKKAKSLTINPLNSDDQIRGNLNLITYIGENVISLTKNSTFSRRVSKVSQHPLQWFQLLVGLAETVPVHRTTPQLPLTAEIQ